MTMTFVPLSDNILVRPDEPITKTAGGILLPDTAQKKAVRGTVLAVGPGRSTVTNGGVEITARMRIKVGDVVQYSNYAGSEASFDDEETLLIMRQEDVFGVVTGVAEGRPTPPPAAPRSEKRCDECAHLEPGHHRECSQFRDANAPLG